MKQHIRVPMLVALTSLGLIACSDADSVGEHLGMDSSPIGGNPALERYIVKFHDFSKRHGPLQAAGAAVALELPDHGAVAAYLPEAAANGLAHHPSVEYVEIDPKRYPMAQTTPYGIEMVQATDPVFPVPGELDLPAKVKVCIIDSGLYKDHADLKDLPVTGEAGTDGCGHGTHVAGTIAAVNNSDGVVGVAPNFVALHIVRVFGDNCSWNYSSTLVGALDKCSKAGAKVVSMSLGGSGQSILERRAFQKAYKGGILSIAAAGNGGSTQTTYPAGYPSVVSVAAIDQNKAHASFSQQNNDVEIAAPGVGVLSTVPWGSGYEAWSGTSMATPHVSGVAALIWSFNSSWTNQQIRNAIDYTAQDLGTAGRDTSFGHGLVQAKAALDYLQK